MNNHNKFHLYLQKLRKAQPLSRLRIFRLQKIQTPPSFTNITVYRTKRKNKKLLQLPQQRKCPQHDDDSSKRWENKKASTREEENRRRNPPAVSEKAAHRHTHQQSPHLRRHNLETPAHQKCENGGGNVAMRLARTPILTLVDQ